MRKIAFLLLSIILSLLALQVPAKVFPKNFTWGVASASYQIEGAWNISGKGQSIWDSFTATPGRVAKNQTGQVADDFYHLYPEDIALMKSLGIKNYRMSISWPRILPKGTVDQPNPEGVKFYNDLFAALLAAGIEPWVGLYHWDLPQALDDKSDKGGWLNPDIPNIYNAYADFCFKNFGDKVKNWLTFNEINTFSWIGYGSGVHAPGRCSPDRGSWCQSVGGGGNSSTEPYIVTHNALIAHALAVNTYRTKYQKTQGGQIGMTMGSSHVLPWDPNNPDDVKAVDINLAFSLGWFADPQVFGQYPQEMRDFVTGNRLPEFNETMSQLIKGSYDFLGINHYTSTYVSYTGVVGNSWDTDSRTLSSPYDVNGHLIGPFAESTWINVYPPGLRGLLNWASKRYNHAPLYVFENGVSCPNESRIPVEQALNDTFRVDYLKGYIGNLALTLIEDGVDVRGYFLWSLMDNFEWADGYDVRFGAVYVDYENGLKRLPKKSMKWYSDLINILVSEESHYMRGTDAMKKMSIAYL